MVRRRRHRTYALTEKEKRDPKLRIKLTRCIKEVEEEQCSTKALMKDGTYNYTLCKVNPITICRTSQARSLPPS